MPKVIIHFWDTPIKLNITEEEKEAYLKNYEIDRCMIIELIIEKNKDQIIRTLTPRYKEISFVEENEWKSTLPPHDTLVEVETELGIIKVRAIWRDLEKGILPHWESEDGNTLYHLYSFNRWREISK